MLVDWSEDRNGSDRANEGQLDRLELSVRGQFRRPPALRPDRVADQRGQAGRHHVDRRAGDDLVGALIDRSVAVDERNGDRRGDSGKQSQPDVAGEGRHRGRTEGADQYFAFETDVDDA